MPDSSVKQLNVLVIGTPDGLELPLDWPAAHARLEFVENSEMALRALRRMSFDLVLSKPADFATGQFLHGNHQASAILESVAHGVCVVAADGDLEWCNSRMLAHSEEVRQRVHRCCTETVEWTRTAEPHQVHARRFNLATSTNEQYEVNVTPVLDLQRRVTHAAAVVTNQSNARRLQEQIDAIDRAGCELLSIDVDQYSRMEMADRLALLEQKILRCTQELLHFDNFVVFVLDKKSKRLDPVLVWGMPEERAHTELYASSEGNGISGHVAIRGRSYICPDTENDPRYRRGIDHARSSLTVPLLLHDEVVGVANFESTRLAAFSEDDRQFAEIFARYIALSLHLLELLVCERRTITGNLIQSVMGQVTGPLNDLLTDTETLVEDYIGHDDLRQRLRGLSENAVKIREAIKALSAPQQGVLGTRVASTAQQDPLLSGKRILIADDEEIIRDTVRDVLTGFGCVVHAVDDGAAAIALIKAQPFDLVLSDIKMPSKTGYEVFAAAKEANPQTPVILATGFGYDPNHSIVRARREGLTAVLFKPFKVDQLLAEIRNALKTAAPA